MTEDIPVEVTDKIELDSDDHEEFTRYEGTVNGKEWTAERLAGEDYIAIDIDGEYPESEAEAIRDQLWHR